MAKRGPLQKLLLVRSDTYLLPSHMINLPSHMINLDLLPSHMINLTLLLHLLNNFKI